jgi:cyanophycinase
MMNGQIALVGGNEFRPDCEAMDRTLLGLLGPQPRVLILPTAAARQSPELAAQNGIRYFQSLNARAEAAMILDEETSRQPSFLSQIQSADLCYFTGGDPVHLLQTMRDSPAWKAILNRWKEGGMLAGSSAGAMILGGKLWAPGQGWRNGLGLLPEIGVIPHHASLASRWDASRLRETLAPEMVLVGIDEATALAGPSWKVIGEGKAVLYRGNKKEIFRSGQTIPVDFKIRTED